MKKERPRSSSMEKKEEEERNVISLRKVDYEEDGNDYDEDDATVTREECSHVSSISKLR